MNKKQGFRNKALKDSRKRNLELFWLCIPALLVLFIFNYLPMGGVILAFKNFKPLEGIMGSPWVGFKNFKFFITSPQMWKVTRNTLAYNGIFIILTPVISVTIAILLSEMKKGIFVKIYQTIFFLPFFLSWVVVSIMLYAFLKTDSGFINTILVSLGQEPVNWYIRADLWPGIIIFMAMWKNVGYNSVIYYAGLMGIDPSLYEAASIDGATRFQKIFKITIPMLTPIIVILMILGVGKIFFADFGLFYQLPLQNGLLLPTTDVINYYVYRILTEVNDIGMGSAIGLFQSFMGMILMIFTMWLSKKISNR